MITFFFLGVALFGFIFWLWTIFRDYKQYKATEQIKFLIGPLIGIIFLITIFGINWKNESDLNKPTLVRAFYDGDFNGTGIDFKTDGTYIFNNSAIGLSDYTYGTYKISGQKITLDKNEIDNVIKTNLLEIKDVKENGVDYLAGEYLFQIEPNGNEIKRATKFRIVVDNRTE
ncbi:hypothetical protein [Mesonia maritima]|uniref:Uncharacterized protein n=1 Tax=Mesonia maritima TaxID=1793873 RepID=A0ABU1KCT8_9FLAO|nr:hypothetical protein [Mesonia maritima]MDR6302282.1 hypothetical protein [Mesonia maritima]